MTPMPQVRASSVAESTATRDRRPDRPLAVVVGAGGMAMAIARRLGVSYRLAVADRDEAHLRRQIEALEAEGHDAVGFVCDVTDSLAVANLARAVRETGPFRALAHVVGLSPSMSDGPGILRVDLAGAALVADAFEEMLRPGSAAVFIASLAAHLGAVTKALASALEDPLAADLVDRVEAALDADIDPGLAYTLAKYGLIQMCRGRASRWGRRGARIMSVSPGLIATPQGAREFDAQPSKKLLLEATPLGRQGTMLEMAEVVYFLLSDHASYINGVDLLVDGGLAAALRPGPGGQTDQPAEELPSIDPS